MLADVGALPPTLTAVREGGGWHVSLLGTPTESTLRIRAHMEQLTANGSLDDPGRLARETGTGALGT